MISCKRDEFSLQRNSAYLNCAYMSPLMREVELEGIEALKSKREPHLITPDDFFKNVKLTKTNFAKLINTSQERIAIVPSVSYGMGNVINNLIDKGEILMVEGQFPSNVYPWLSLKERGFQIKFIEKPNSKTVGKDWNASIIHAINENTRVVAIGHVHWTDGTFFRLEEIREKLDEVGGLLIIDGTQSIGALPFDVEKIRPDAVICAGYKWLMGPYSLGLAYYGSYFDNGKPIEEGWINRLESDEFGKLVNYQDEYRPAAARYSVGESSNFNLIPMLNKALIKIIEWQPKEIQAYCRNLCKDVIDEIQDLGFSIENEAFRSSHIFGLYLNEGMDINRIKETLVKNKIYVSYRGDAIRVSPHVYNDEIDLLKLLNGLKEAIFVRN